MTDPNQRSRKHGRPQTGRNIPDRPEANPQQDYYDSTGNFHPAAQSNPKNPRLNTADQSNTATPQNNRRSPHTRKNRRAGFFVKIFLLLLLCLAFGLVWHYISGRDFSGTDGKSNPKANAAAANHIVVTPANTGTTLPNTQIISFSDDPAKPLYEKIIILDPGHGGTDSGCIYPANNPKYTESVINLRIAESTKAALESQGATVIMLRTDDSWVSLYHRIALTHLYCLQYADEFGVNTISAKDKSRLVSELSDTIKINSDTVDTGGMGIMVGTGVGADLQLLMNLEKNFTDILYISIHINSNPTSSLHGTQVYYVTDESVIASEKNVVAEDPSYQNNPNYPLRDDYFGRDGARNQLLAQTLYDSIIVSAPQMETNAETVLEDNYAVLRENNITGALIEVGFLTNNKDRKNLTSDSSIAEISSGIASGCVNFFTGNS